MGFVQIDWFVIVIAATLNLLIGFFWYSRWLFGSLWEKLSRRSGKNERMDLKAFAMSVFISFTVAFFLSLFQGWLGIVSVTDGMYMGFLFWLAFVVTTQVSTFIWYKQPFQLFLIDSGYKLLSFLVMSGLIGA